jgi:hypothetical protein
MHGSLGTCWHDVALNMVGDFLRELETLVKDCFPEEPVLTDENVVEGLWHLGADLGAYFLEGLLKEDVLEAVGKLVGVFDWIRLDARLKAEYLQAYRLIRLHGPPPEKSDQPIPMMTTGQRAVWV